MRVYLVLMMLLGFAMVMSGRDENSFEDSKRVEYRYLPRDLDTYIREDLRYPSLVYKSMFTDGDVIR
jgi:hypothetical protein